VGFSLYTVLPTFKITTMEDELNYLSEKIYTLENNIAIIHERLQQSNSLKDELKRNERELSILNNIMNALTISELT